MFPLRFVWLLILAFLSALLGRGSQRELPQQWLGLCGENLKEAIRTSSLPTAYLDTYTGEGSIWEILRLTDFDDAGANILNRFSYDVLPWGYPGDLPPTANLVSVVNGDWWKLSSPYGNHTLLDLYNRYPCLNEVFVPKGSLPPGRAEEPEPQYVFPRWKVGKGIYEGEYSLVWEIDDEYKGDVARVMMYMLTLYPESLRTAGPMTNFIAFSSWKILTESAARTMLAWSDADPVSAVEIRRNNHFEERQGNRNPFVDFPHLASHIWGANSNTGLGETIEYEGSPLRGVYHLTDEAIYLYSPYIPAQCTWSIDGQPVTGETLNPTKVGTGKHKLSYVSETRRGVLYIQILE